MNMIKVLSLIIIGGTSVVVATGILNKKSSNSNCIEGLNKEYQMTKTDKSMLEHKDGGMMMIVPTPTGNVKMMGFLSPKQLGSLRENMENIGINVVSLESTGTCTHEANDFEYTTFSGEYGPK